MNTPDSSYKTYPFAVITPELGKISETFIYRHITELLPGKTVVIARSKDTFWDDNDISFPYILLNNFKYNFTWLYRSILYFLHINKLSPVQVTVEKYFKKYKPRVILSEYLDASLKWLDVAQKLGIKFYTHAHGYDVSKMLRDQVLRQQYLRLEKADGIITMSEYSRKKLIDIGLSDKNIHIIPYGINVPDVPRAQQSQDTIRCLAVGRMVTKKAPLLTLKAFQAAVTENPKLRLGYIGNGELFEEASRFVHEHSLNSFVTLHGSQPNSTVHEFMKKTDIFIQHSITDPVTGDEEGLPVAILEAMANSLPVVSTRHAGIPEAVNEGSTGYLVDEGDISKMAVCILKLADNISIRNNMGLAGWERAKKHYSWKQEKKRLLELLGL